MRIEIRPREPIDLLASARGLTDATRGTFGRTVSFQFRTGRAKVVQVTDGSLVAELSGETSEALDELRFALGLDAPRAGFFELARHDPLLRRVVESNRGLVPLRSGTVAHAMVHAVCGQLIRAREAKTIENRIVRRASVLAGADSPGVDRLVASPLASELARLSPARLASLGLAPRRAEALRRLLRRAEPERLRALPTAPVVALLTSIPGIGPWSAAKIALVGLGRYDVPLVGDLGLIRLASSLNRRQASVEDTVSLLAPYGEWSGLASSYLMRLPVAREAGPRGLGQRSRSPAFARSTGPP